MTCLINNFIPCVEKNIILSFKQAISVFDVWESLFYFTQMIDQQVPLHNYGHFIYKPSLDDQVYFRFIFHFILHSIVDRQSDQFENVNSERLYFILTKRKIKKKTIIK
jgi:hypothetical protein